MLDCIKITLETHSRRKNVIILSLCMQRCYGRHSFSRKLINHRGVCFCVAKTMSEKMQLLKEKEVLPRVQK